MPASYLVRFDDLSPTMDLPAWEAIEEILLREDIKPILAVIPNNQDDALRFQAEDTGFWDRVRRWQAYGWTIGLHGYSHQFLTSDAGIMGLNPFSEFAGTPIESQRERLQQALAICAQHQVSPKIWVAPAHSFDAQTLQVLRELQLPLVSDGFALYPFEDGGGMTWIPQQIWRFREVPFGVWTVCIHHNRWTAADFERFARDIRTFKARIVSLEDVLATYPARRQGWSDACFSAAWRSMLAAKQLAKRRAGFQ